MANKEMISGGIFTPACRPGEPCWKSKKRACGYKEIALHHAAEHGLFEKIIEADERPEVQDLVKKIEEAGGRKTVK